MKCGDIVRNHWAGERNPTRYFIYLKNNGKYSEVINFDGKKLRRGKYYNSSFKENPDKFVVVGHINLIGFIKTPLMELLNADNPNADRRELSYAR